MNATYEHWLIFGLITVVTWILFTHLWPRLFLYVFKRAILVKGGGDGPIPINTLYTESPELFTDPLHAPATASRLMTTGVNHDTLLTVGWLDLGKGPLVLHVPDMPDRYYSVQFSDPAKNTNFAYVGTRVTGTHAGDYLITPPDWHGQVPGGMARISSPNDSVLIVGRVLVINDGDAAAAYALSKQIQLIPLSGRG